MAVLKALGSSLEITPVTPSIRGPRDAYDVAIWQEDENNAVFRHQYNVHGWQIGHSEILNIARAFQVVHRLADMELPLNLYRVDNNANAKSREHLSKPMCLCLDVIWIHVKLSADLRKPDSSEVDVNLELFLWTSPDEDYAPNAIASEPLTRFVFEDFYIRNEEAKRFGAALQRECIEGQKLRRELHLKHFDDAIDFV
jgi:hypothetical protein